MEKIFRAKPCANESSIRELTQNFPIWHCGASLHPFHFPRLPLFSRDDERHYSGWRRWLAVGLIAHIIATYLSEGVLYLQIEIGAASEKLVNATDIGVSYFVTGLVAVLAYHITMPWRWAYIAVVSVAFTVALVWHLGFTGLGHLFAVVIGLCCYPLTHGRPGPWDPASVLARLRRTNA